MLLLSNRLPVEVTKRRGRLRFQESIGGLATGLSSFHSSADSVWIGWPGTTREQVDEDDIKTHLQAEDLSPVFLSHDEAENYYRGFCNKTLWPLFNYFPQHTLYKEEWWKIYDRVNQLYSDAVLSLAEPTDTIWIHDYHLMLLPKLIRQEIPDATVGFFLHIPFPSFEIFRLLPWRRQVVEGLLGADLIGFHTYSYVWNFIDSVRRLLGHECSLGVVVAGNRTVKVDAFPLGIDYRRFASASAELEVQRQVQAIRRKFGHRKVILSIDRLDYTKGIPLRLRAFDTFLERNPEYKGQVTLVLVASPSRTDVEHYEELKKRVDEIIGRINGRHGSIGWVPIWYLYRRVPQHTLLALYVVADVTLLTPLRDGMNLISKEYVATKSDGKGVLILSEMAGAAQELGQALIVNPNNMEEIAEALKAALEMPVKEQIERNRTMQERLQRYDITRWTEDFLDGLHGAKRLQRDLRTKSLTSEMKRTMIQDYSTSTSRLVLLDYDGTLVPFAERPQEAQPDEELLKLLEELSEDPKNELVIISGRNRESLEDWFGGLEFGLTAEHGAWIKERDGEWESTKTLDTDWKTQIRPILEHYVDRTPGSFTEDKDFSLAWHYRRSDPELGSLRMRELKGDLLQLTSNLDLAVLEGSKVVEVKNIGVDKGQAALRWVSKQKWGFILGIGDDWTDEDFFAVLPPSAHSIRVGFEATKARSNVDSVGDVRSLLEELLDTH
ncbi:MAG: bifunctional alpha,alpha-trehalose-phosphate synthase (UDP-forming)/trehalose-phosphatase [Candidatus Geothermarchaeales archaeon]